MASAPAAPAVVAPSLAERLDGYVERAQAAATSFRELNQGEVDKNYIATESLGRAEDERRERLFRRVEELLDSVGMPRSLEAAGVAREDFDEALPELARAAFEDASIRTNPRIPLVHELTQLLDEGFHGR